ncbi:hypothetical protein BG261_04075, partial [Floricoccus tropicus]
LEQDLQQPIASKYKVGDTVQIRANASYESNGSDLKTYRNWIGTISAVRADNKSKSNYSYTVTYKKDRNTIQSIYVLEQDLLPSNKVELEKPVTSSSKVNTSTTSSSKLQVEKPKQPTSSSTKTSEKPQTSEPTQPTVKPQVPDTSEPKPQLKLDVLNTTQRVWFDSIYPQIVKLANNNNVYASVMMSQTIAESAWGQSQLAKDANNIFGVKADATWTGAVYEKNTIEYINGKEVITKEKFRKYSSQAESLQDYINKILGSPERYGNVLKSNARTYEEAANALQTGGYATDPNYANSLINRIKNYNLNALD